MVQVIKKCILQIKQAFNRMDSVYTKSAHAIAFPPFASPADLFALLVHHNKPTFKDGQYPTNIATVIDSVDFLSR
jgi:hypothetical protein